MLNIAKNTFKEILRNKIFSLILLFAFLFLLFTITLSELTIGETSKIIIDFGLAMIEVFGVVGVLFVGSQLLFNEVNGKTIFLILSKPIKKHEFLLGKFFGFSAIIFLMVLVQAFIFSLILFFQGIDLRSEILWALGHTFIKLEILLAIVFFFSTFMSNIMTILGAVLLYLVGHSSSVIIDLALQSKSALMLFFSKALATILPPFGALNTKDMIGIFSDIPYSVFFTNALYGLVYITIVLVASILIFNKKSFEN